MKVLLGGLLALVGMVGVAHAQALSLSESETLGSCLDGANALAATIERKSQEAARACRNAQAYEDADRICRGLIPVPVRLTSEPTPTKDTYCDIYRQMGKSGFNGLYTNARESCNSLNAELERLRNQLYDTVTDCYNYAW